MNKKPLLIFDHDGTLHDSMIVFAPAMHNVIGKLNREGVIDIPDPDDEKISTFLGVNSRDIWEDLLGDISDDFCNEISKMVNREMKKVLDSGRARWFDGIDTALDKLKAQGYPMVILSNCEIRLRDFYWDYFNMEKWFDKFYDCESYDFIPKTEIIKIILREKGSRAIMIGDRIMDLECALSGGIPFIGCEYGFAAKKELDRSDAIAKTPMDLPDAVREINNRFYRD